MFYGDEHMRNIDDNVMDDIHQAELWRRFSKVFPTFQEDPDKGVCDLRIGIGISADRASLSKHKPKDDFAILPVLLSIVNWPIWVRNQHKYLLLSSLPPMQSHKPTIYFGTHTYTHAHAHTHTHDIYYMFVFVCTYGI
jgi:hypothetical protein